MKSIQELMAITDEELHPELKPYVYEDDLFGQSLKHPLVFDVIYHPQFNAVLNERYRAKAAALAEAEEEERWNTYVFLHERPHRLDALLEIELAMADEDYWHLIGQVWTDSENIFQRYEEWRDALSDPRPGREHMMDELDRAAIPEFPDTLTVYRGYNGDGTDEGLSWTLNKATARFFAHRLLHRGKPHIVQGTVDRMDVLAYFTSRDESEIVVFPENVERA